MTNEDILTAENTVLGACLCDAPLWGTVLNALHETDLAGDASRAILHAARMLDAEGKTPDAPARPCFRPAVPAPASGYCA